MRKRIFWRIAKVESQHPGFCRQLEAMLEASHSLRAIRRAIRDQYGVGMSRDTLAAYKDIDREVRRALTQPWKDPGDQARDSSGHCVIRSFGD